MLAETRCKQSKPVASFRLKHEMQTYGSARSVDDIFRKKLKEKKKVSWWVVEAL
jgi:hypothetical protein